MSTPVSPLLLSLLLLALPASAQHNRGLKVTTRTPDGDLLELYDNSWAVIIGINQYPKWPSLQYAVNDARAVRDRLLQLGFPRRNVIFLADSQATKDSIESILGDELRRKVGSNDRVFIYFAGHGQTEDLPGGRQEGYIVPVDGDNASLFSSCISMSDVRKFSERIAAKHIFFAIDACYSGLALMRAGEPDTRDRQYLQKVARLPARQLVTAGSAGEQVIEHGGHGAFTKNLLLALDGNADKYPPFGVLTGSELGQYLQPTVSVETDNAQTPQFGRLAGGQGEFIFVLEGSETSDNSRTDQYWKQAAQYDDQIEGLKAQIEAEKWRQAEEEAARVEVEQKRREKDELERQLADLQRQGRPQQTADDSSGETGENFFDMVMNYIMPSPSPDEAETGAGETLEAEISVGEMVAVPDFGFFIDKYEVTNAQYAEFVCATGHRVPACVECGKADSTWQGCRPPPGYEDHPVVGVGWQDAQAYCAWIGKRLPTEDEWQQACQGRDEREYPWGAGIDRRKANYGAESCCGGDAGDGYLQTAPVGRFPAGASPFGASDMAGNVWEWTASGQGTSRVLRGGSWFDPPHDLRCASRSDGEPDFRYSLIGFRCAR